jgi:hypothetical protein
MSRPDLADYLVRMDRRQGAAFVTKNYFRSARAAWKFGPSPGCA